MGILLDAHSAGRGANGASSLTFSATVNSNTNGLLIVGVYSYDNVKTDKVSSVTWNGTGMTKLGGSAMRNYGYMSFYGILTPGTGTHNVVITLSSGSAYGIEGFAASYTGVLQDALPSAGVPNASAYGYGTTGTANLALTSVTDKSWSIAMCMSDNGDPSASTNFTLLDAETVGDTICGHSNGDIAAGSFTMTANAPGHTDWTLSGFAIAFAPVPATTTNKTLSATSSGVGKFVRSTGKIIGTTGHGIAVKSTISSFHKAMAAIGSGVGTIVKHPVWAKIMTSTTTGVAKIAKGMNQAMSVTALAIADINPVRVTLQALSALGNGIAEITIRIGKTLSASGTGTTKFVKSVGKNMTTTASVHAVATIIKQAFQSLSATVHGIATIVKNRPITLSTTSIGITKFVKTVGKNMKATAIATPTILASFKKILTVVATGVVTIRTAISKRMSVVATAIPHIGKSFWKTKYTSKGDSYSPKYKHDN